MVFTPATSEVQNIHVLRVNGLPQWTRGAKMEFTGWLTHAVCKVKRL